MSRPDLLLLHPPSVYDFRKKAIMYGPISDLIPSSPVFEMYPLGFLTITNYLESRGLRVRIINLALRMMNDPDFDVPAFLDRLNPKAIGIDLHWLPHVHGSLEIARLVKQRHPQTPVIFGGLSASYFYDELIRYPQVDYVLRGDATEPSLYELLVYLENGRSLEKVPNLVWKRGDQVQVNPMSFVPDDIDYVDLAPERIIKMVMRYRDLQSVLPFNGWWKNPITAVFNVKGCAHECATCGGSCKASDILNLRKRPAFRSPQNLVKNICDISRFSRGPIFLVGDLLQAGEDYAYQVLSLLELTHISNEMVFEVFGMPSPEFLPAIDRAVKSWSLELSPESHDENVRRRQDTQTFYTNAEMEAVIARALSLDCHRVDVFFMIGLPGQTRESVLATVDYCEQLFRKSDRRLSCFISPMGPFIDPGSHGFESPDRYGYRLFARTLEEHRQLLLQPSWGQILNYETLWMSREQLVDVTYDAAEVLNNLKLRYGRINRASGHGVARRIKQARELKARMAASASSTMDPVALKMLYGDIHTFSVSTVCDKRELFWRRHIMNFKWLEILRVGIACAREQSRQLHTTRRITSEPRDSIT
ncbi:MAG: TIGR04190 family B12-binding domain/radical SAM domain protein [Desulfuromonadales bacterium]|nr:TIGR04190 family B12-binding domain/radical SAM domain protein [Desulfuromonadales bacterium]